MSNPTILIKDVHKKFLECSFFVHILRGVNFSLSSGEIVGLVGESGTGKSTLLHLIGLLDSVTVGGVVIDGVDMSHASERERTKFRRDNIGFVYQKHHLLSEYTVLENIMMPLLIQGVSKSEAKKRAFRLMERVGIDHRSQYPITKISGGEQQRASVARALIKKPKILLADEPTGNLDQETGEKVFSLFLDLAKEQNVTMLMVTHNQSLMEKMDRVLFLKNGTVKERL
ncbi:ABC transporter ATP-binding protein [Alphaproteobacteria bacterium]|nr:ABC transporter ATP-binding protein [Alphaproteobacteria bacterium]